MVKHKKKYIKRVNIYSTILLLTSLLQHVYMHQDHPPLWTGISDPLGCLMPDIKPNICNLIDKRLSRHKRHRKSRTRVRILNLYWPNLLNNIVESWDTKYHIFQALKSILTVEFKKSSGRYPSMSGSLTRRCCYNWPYRFTMLSSSFLTLSTILFLSFARLNHF